MKKYLPILVLCCCFSSVLYGQIFSTAKLAKFKPDNQIRKVLVPDLPFTEDFSSGTFATNQWTADTNWIISGQTGNQAPCAEFHFSPPLTNYESSLTSNYFNADEYHIGKILLDFDLKVTTINNTGAEELAVQVDSGTGWTDVALFDNVSNTTWESYKIEITEPALGKDFRIRFLARGENSLNISSWLIDNINIYRHCLPPSDLTVDNVTNHYEWLKIEWMPPESPDPATNDWLHRDNGNNFDAIGLADGGTFTVADRFTTEELAEYVGTNLTKIRIFPYSSGGTIVLKVWTGPDATQLVISQPVYSYTPGVWNEFILNTPIPIPDNEELWFGYEVTQNNNNYIAGCDNGPANAGYGDLISLDGITWESLATIYGNNYNWNLQGWVETPTYDPPVGLTGYNIYSWEQLIGFTTETSYIDTNPFSINNNWEYCYNVTAVYEDCESVFSASSCLCILDVANTEISTSVYPNPANDMVKIELDSDISNLIIYDFVGKVVFEKVINGERNIQVNVSNYCSGAYIVKIITRTGEILSRKIIVSR